jgi:hypothetical protein
VSEKTASDQTFIPSLVVNFRLLFDPTLSVRDISSVPTPDPQDGIVDAVSSADTSAAQVRPLVTQRGNTNFSKIVNRVPKTASIELPAYRTAGKFSLEIDWREMPIDPRLIKALGVEIFVGTVQPSDFAAGMVSGKNDGVRLRSSVLSTQGTDGRPRDDLMVLAGIMDNWALTRGEPSYLKMEGRDLRGIMLDSPINPLIIAKIDLRRNLIQVIADIIKTHPAAQFLQIVYNLADWDNDTVPPVSDAEGLTRVRRGADGTKTTGGSPSSDQTSYWDLVVQYCYLVGAVPFFRGRYLVIRPARAIFDQSKPAMDATVVSPTGGVLKDRGVDANFVFDPVFQDGFRVDDDNKKFTYRKFILGRNVKELSFERKYTGTKVPVIRVVSYDTSSTNRGSSKLLTAEYPPKSESLARVTGISPSGDQSQTDVKIISVPGVRNQSKLNTIAQNLYEEIGRGEFGGSCKTGFLASFKGDNSDPDILRLRPGHLVEFAMDARPLSSVTPAASSELALERASFDAAAKEIQQRLGTDDENLSRAIVASSRGNVIGQLQVFRVANVKFEWNQDAGLQTSFDFQNYFLPYKVTPETGANTQQVTRVNVQRSPARNPKGEIAGQTHASHVSGPRGRSSRGH